MVGTLNLYLDSDLSYTWRQASLLTAKSFGRSGKYARSIQTWIHTYLNHHELPLNKYAHPHASPLDDEDICEAIQMHLMQIVKEKKYIRALDIVNFISSTPEIQEKKANGMYIDGHEREDVVAYRNTFVERWKEYERRMIQYDNDGNVAVIPEGFPVPRGQPFPLHVNTHDESTFFANDRRKKNWNHESQTATPVCKGKGMSIMVSDFLSPEWGRLTDGDEEARIFFHAGKNRDGYFTADDLLAQVDKAIDIFEGKTKGFAVGLWLFDNAPSHQKRAADALSARYMPKMPSATWEPKEGVKMHPGYLPNGEIQSLYFDEDHPEMPGWFKGMKQIIQERGLWPEGRELRAHTDCCCRRLLFTQPDFNSLSPDSRGHICDFYPKYHPELNFIEQYWGAAKFLYRSTPPTDNVQQMEANMKTCLDSVSLLSIRRFANRSARFFSAYAQGLDGAEASWANRKYHGHRTLPSSMIAKASNFNVFVEIWARFSFKNPVLLSRTYVI
ncbi:hypothetical protein K474DRAFT_1687385 [Panus rudis PR-1116 ss-1]|nr:hypothetical protein K474DRAFT_1687385 [Panus rudis PR-1116 ss-1]